MIHLRGRVAFVILLENCCVVVGVYRTWCEGMKDSFVAVQHIEDVQLSSKPIGPSSPKKFSGDASRPVGWVSGVQLVNSPIPNGYWNPFFSVALLSCASSVDLTCIAHIRKCGFA